MIRSLLGLDPNSGYTKSQILCSLNSKTHDYPTATECHGYHTKGELKYSFLDSTELRTKKI